MTIPNVYMKWCHRTAICKWCENPIEPGSPIVSVFFWNKGSEDHKGFNTKLYFHPDCWVAQGLDYLKLNPYAPYTRHKESTLTPEQKKLRHTIMTRKASIEQRRRNLKPTSKNRLLIEARLDIQIAQLMVEIAPIGGIPKKWIEQI